MKSLMFILYLFLALSGFTASAEFEHVITQPLAVFADIVPRNARVGEDESQYMRFYKWIFVTDQMSLGLTKEGQLYGLVSMEKEHPETGQKASKFYAYLLSGLRDIREVFLDGNGTLWAIDGNGSVLVFDREQWSKTPMMKIMSGWGLNLLDDISIFGILFLVTKRLFFTPWDLDPIPTAIVAGLGAVGFSISQFLRTANQYGRLNAQTDAFVSTGVHIDLGPGIKERFATLAESIKLNPDQVKNRDLFNRKCELELLPLPVDHSTWKP